MSLDTVELVYKIEAYFGINIPDTQLEQMGTVQDFTDGVCLALGVSDQAKFSRTFELTFSVLQRELAALLPAAPLFPSLRLADILPEEPSVLRPRLKILAQRTGWRFPRLPKPIIPSQHWAAKLIAQYVAPRRPDWRQDSLADLAGWIISLNYQEFYSGHSFQRRYDVLRAVVGLIHEQAGVNVWEIHPADSITNDLGID